MRTRTNARIEVCDTIVAIASAAGFSGRGILRISGPLALETVSSICSLNDDVILASTTGRARSIDSTLVLPDSRVRLPATLIINHSPCSYTGDNLVEIHTVGSTPLLEVVLHCLSEAGARVAQPGEFTMRAFLNGKIDLTAAEAVGGLIDASTERAAQVALEQLAGGIANPIQQLRDKLLDMLADLEAELDFVEEDIHFVDDSHLLETLNWADEETGHLVLQMSGRLKSQSLARVVLVGPPNSGKSSLFNAMLDNNTAITSSQAGTTRDYLTGLVVDGDGTEYELMDTAGVEQARTPVEQQSQIKRADALESADLAIVCSECSLGSSSQELEVLSCPIISVSTKCDLAPDFNPLGSAHVVSSVTGEGISELRGIVAETLSTVSPDGSVVPTTAVRCRESMQNGLTAIRRARQAVLSRESREFVALELRVVLEEYAQVVGAVYTDDILDRIFSRFCIGK